MKKYIRTGLSLGFFMFGLSGLSQAASLIITGVIDGPLTGGTPKAVELYVLNDISDLGIYGIGSANNGGGSDGIEFTFPAMTAAAGSFLYVASDIVEFENFFGFGPDSMSPAANINGDDAVELYRNGAVVDVFGDIAVDGTGQPWEYLDGWAYRNDGTGGMDTTTFMLAEWRLSGINSLDGETSNAAAGFPFPAGSYSPGLPRQPLPTPEPATIILLGSGLACLAGKKRLRKCAD